MPIEFLFFNQKFETTLKKLNRILINNLLFRNNQNRLR